MNVLEHNNLLVHYKVIKSNRRTISIMIPPTKEVIVRAPKQISPEQIKNIIKSNADWIVKKLSDMPDTIKPMKEDYAQGDKILYRGKEYIIKIKKGMEIKKSSIVLEDNEIVVVRKTNETKKTKELLLEWYKSNAKCLVKERVAFYMPQINQPMGEIRIKSQRKRWGSCSGKGNLNFNWKIIMMPDEMFDYIIVHELCHLKHLNHSKLFWEYVKRILPDYKVREYWIKENTFKLDF